MKEENQEIIENPTKQEEIPVYSGTQDEVKEKAENIITEKRYDFLTVSKDGLSKEQRTNYEQFLEGKYSLIIPKDLEIGNIKLYEKVFLKLIDSKLLFNDLNHFKDFVKGKTHELNTDETENIAHNIQRNHILFAIQDFFIFSIYKIVEKYGEEFIGKIFNSFEKISNFKKIINNQRKEDKIGRINKLLFDSNLKTEELLNLLDINPYICDILNNITTNDLEYAINLYTKISSQIVTRQEITMESFIYFINATKQFKPKLDKIDFTRDWLRDNKYLDISLNNTINLIGYDVFSTTKIKDLYTEKQDYINNLVKKYNLYANEIRIDEYKGLDMVLSNDKKLTNLKYLSEKSELQEYIKENFEVHNLNDLIKIVGMIFENKSSNDLQDRINAVKKYEELVFEDKNKKIEHLLFLNSEYDLGFIKFITKLFEDTGFCITYDSINIHGLKTKNIKEYKLWAENPEIYQIAVDKKIIGKHRSLEFYFKYFHQFKMFKILLTNDEELLNFIIENEDISMFESGLEQTKYDLNGFFKNWFNNKAIFNKAKQLGLFKNSENLTKIENITKIVTDEKMLDFLKENEFLETAINYQRHEQYKNVIQWLFNSKYWTGKSGDFEKAKEIGIFEYDKENIFKFNDYIDSIERLRVKDIPKIKKVLKENDNIFLTKIDIFDDLGMNVKPIFKKNPIEIKYNSDIFTKYINYIIPLENEKKSIQLKNFMYCIENGKNISKIKTSITKENFLDYLPDNEPLITFEKDNNLNVNPKPWTKAWFLEDLKRKEFLNKDTIDTFKKFGTTIALGLLGGLKDKESFKKEYDYILSKITRETERSTVLQIGEIFGLLISKEKYDFFSDITGNPEIGEFFKSMVEEYDLCDKMKTIITLMFSCEINTAYQTQTAQDIINIINTVFKKLKSYEVEIKKYSKENIPEGLRTSTGVEIEVTKSIAEGYKNRTNSDYKQDIEILSSYSGIAKGNDAIHEIATKPTDNPYLLLLELKLLQDLDFLDLNFKHADYEKGNRSFHNTFGGEYGIHLNENANFIQNIILGANLGGINMNNEVSKVNKYSNIREKGSDCEEIFDEKTECTEYRAVSIDKIETLERYLTSMFNLHIAKQAVEKYTNLIKDIEYIGGKRLRIDSENSSWFNTLAYQYNQINSFDMFVRYFNMANLFEKDLDPNNIQNKKYLEIIYAYVILNVKIINAIKDHNENFIKNEALSGNYLREKTLLLDGLIMGGKSELVKIFNNYKINIENIFDIAKQELLNEDEFFNKLEKYKKTDYIFKKTESKMIYLWYKKYIFEPIQTISKNQYELAELYSFFTDEENTNDFYRKITNYNRFESVIAGDKKYLESIKINPDDLFKTVTAELINKFTKINNLFLKKDSTNAMSMLNTTKEIYGINDDKSCINKTTFDHIDSNSIPRKGRYIIQGASEKMLVNQIQDSLIEFNNSVENVLKS